MKPLHPDPRGDDPHDVAEGVVRAAVVILDHAADREARILAGGGEGGVEMVAADIVEIDVDPLRRGLDQLLDDRPGLVVDRRVGAELAHPGDLVGAAGRADHGHALGLGDLHHRRSDRARRGRDEDDVAFLRLGDPEQPEIGGAAGEAEIAEPLMVLDRQRRHLVERLGRARPRPRASRACGRRCRPPRSAASGSRPPCRPRRPASARRARTAAT